MICIEKLVFREFIGRDKKKRNYFLLINRINKNQKERRGEIKGHEERIKNTKYYLF